MVSQAEELKTITNTQENLAELSTVNYQKLSRMLLCAAGLSDAALIINNNNYISIVPYTHLDEKCMLTSFINQRCQPLFRWKLR